MLERFFNEVEVGPDDYLAVSECAVAGASGGEHDRVDGWTISSAILYRKPDGDRSPQDYEFAYITLGCDRHDESCPRAAVGNFEVSLDPATGEVERPTLRIDRGPLAGWQVNIWFAQGESGGLIHFYSPGAVAAQDACNTAG